MTVAMFPGDLALQDVRGQHWLLTMGRAGCWRAPAPALHICRRWGGESCAKAAVWRGGSWISLAFRGFNKGLKGAELFCAAETCCSLVSGSAGSGGVWGCRVLPARLTAWRG